MKSVPLEIMSRFQNTLNESISLNNHVSISMSKVNTLSTIK
jgi:hypothetical protein